MKKPLIAVVVLVLVGAGAARAETLSVNLNVNLPPMGTCGNSGTIGLPPLPIIGG